VAFDNPSTPLGGRAGDAAAEAFAEIVAGKAKVSSHSCKVTYLSSGGGDAVNRASWSGP
jgi:hypothetical protein